MRVRAGIWNILIKREIKKERDKKRPRHFYSVDASVQEEEEEEEDHIFDSFLTLRNSAMLEKYFWLASATFFSAACGLTISSPYR